MLDNQPSTSTYKGQSSDYTILFEELVLKPLEGVVLSKQVFNLLKKKISEIAKIKPNEIEKKSDKEKIENFQKIKTKLINILAQICEENNLILRQSHHKSTVAKRKMAIVWSMKKEIERSPELKFLINILITKIKVIKNKKQIFNNFFTNNHKTLDKCDNLSSFYDIMAIKTCAKAKAKANAKANANANKKRYSLLAYLLKKFFTETQKEILLNRLLTDDWSLIELSKRQYKSPTVNDFLDQKIKTLILGKIKETAVNYFQFQDDILKINDVVNELNKVKDSFYYDSNKQLNDSKVNYLSLSLLLIELLMLDYASFLLRQKQEEKKETTTHAVSYNTLLSTLILCSKESDSTSSIDKTSEEYKQWSRGQDLLSAAIKNKLPEEEQKTITDEDIESIKSNMLSRRYRAIDLIDIVDSDYSEYYEYYLVYLDKELKSNRSTRVDVLELIVKISHNTIDKDYCREAEEFVTFKQMKKESFFQGRGTKSSLFSIITKRSIQIMEENTKRAKIQTECSTFNLPSTSTTEEICHMDMQENSQLSRDYPMLTKLLAEQDSPSSKPISSNLKFSEASQISPNALYYNN